MPDIKVVWDNAKWCPEINSFIFTCPICSRSYSSKLFLRTGYFQQACEKHLQTHETEAINGWNFCGVRDLCAHADVCHGPVDGTCNVVGLPTTKSLVTICCSLDEAAHWVSWDRKGSLPAGGAGEVTPDD